MAESIPVGFHSGERAACFLCVLLLRCVQEQGQGATTTPHHHHTTTTPPPPHHHTCPSVRPSVRLSLSLGPYFQKQISVTCRCCRSGTSSARCCSYTAQRPHPNPFNNPFNNPNPNRCSSYTAQRPLSMPCAGPVLALCWPSPCPVLARCVNPRLTHQERGAVADVCVSLLLQDRIVPLAHAEGLYNLVPPPQPTRQPLSHAIRLFWEYRVAEIPPGNQAPNPHDPYWAEGAGHNDIVERRDHHWCHIFFSSFWGENR